MVLCGDFLQLPPVTESGREPVFAFDARCWQAVVSRRINLTEVFRQKDQRFVDMLNEVRFGSLSARTVEAFAGMSRAVKYEDGLEPTVRSLPALALALAQTARRSLTPNVASLPSAGAFLAPGPGRDGQPRAPARARGRGKDVRRVRLCVPLVSAGLLPGLCGCARWSDC